MIVWLIIGKIVRTVLPVLPSDFSFLYLISMFSQPVLVLWQIAPQAQLRGAFSEF